LHHRTVNALVGSSQSTDAIKNLQEREGIGAASMSGWRGRAVEASSKV